MSRGCIGKKGVNTVQWVFPQYPEGQRPREERSNWFHSPEFRTTRLKWYMSILLDTESDALDKMQCVYLARKNARSEDPRIFQCSVSVNRWGGEQKRMLRKEVVFQHASVKLLESSEWVKESQEGGISSTDTIIVTLTIEGEAPLQDRTLVTTGTQTFILDPVRDCVLRGGAASRETQTEDPNSEEGSSPEEKAISKLSSHLEVLMIEGKDRDVTFRVKEEAFKAHKDLLRCRSPVFAAMFGHDTQENASGTITIEDCDPEAFGAFLKFVYTGTVRIGSPKSAIGLYYLADKYDFEELKRMCVEHLGAHLSTDTICDVIGLAKTHCDAELLRSAVAFFSRNLEEILVTVEWQRFMQQNSTVANELFINAVKTGYKKL